MSAWSENQFHYSQTEENYNILGWREESYWREFWLLQQSGVGGWSWFIWFLISRMTDIWNVLFEIHAIWNHETKVASAACKRNVSTANTKRGGLSVTESVSVWLYKENLCLVFIQFQFVWCHPGLHIRDACLHGQDNGMCLIRRTRVKQSCAVGNRLVGDRMSLNQRGERCRVKNEEDRTKNWALWDTTGNIHWFWTPIVDSHSLSPTCKVWLKPRKNGARNAVERSKPVQENMVVHSIESRRQIKKGQDSYITIIKSMQNIVSNVE